MNQDERHLDLLAVLHYVLGGMLALFFCFPLIHITIGILMVGGFFEHGGHPPPEVIGWAFIVAGSIAVSLGWTLATLIVLAGRRLKRRRSYTFCFVIAGIECMFIPLGPALGVCTIVGLMRDSARMLFDGQSCS